MIASVLGYLHVLALQTCSALSVMQGIHTAALATTYCVRNPNTNKLPLLWFEVVYAGTSTCRGGMTCASEQGCVTCRDWAS